LAFWLFRKGNRVFSSFFFSHDKLCQVSWWNSSLKPVNLPVISFSSLCLLVPPFFCVPLPVFLFKVFSFPPSGSALPQSCRFLTSFSELVLLIPFSVSERFFYLGFPPFGPQVFFSPFFMRKVQRPERASPANQFFPPFLGFWYPSSLPRSTPFSPPVVFLFPLGKDFSSWTTLFNCSPLFETRSPLQGQLDLAMIPSSCPLLSAPYFFAFAWFFPSVFFSISGDLIFPKKLVFFFFYYSPL